MREYVEDFKPLRQRTVRSETTKDKCGTLPIAMYLNQDKLRAHQQDYESVIREESDDSDVSEDEVSADECTQSDSEKAHDQDDEYDSESDSENDFDDNSVAATNITRSDRTVHASVKLEGYLVD